MRTGINHTARGRGEDNTRRKRKRTHLGLYDLQIPHLNAARREIGYLELDADWSLALSSLRASHAAAEPTRHTTAMLVIALDRRQIQFGPHEELLAAAELLDLPHNGGFLRRVVHGSDVGAEAGRVGVFGDGDEDFDVVSRGAAFELGSCLDGESSGFLSLGH